MRKRKPKFPRVPLLMSGDVAAITGLSQATICRMVRDKEIPHIKFGRQARFREDVIRRWLAERTFPPHPELQLEAETKEKI